jgi:hypothetical protein
VVSQHTFIYFVNKDKDKILKERYLMKNLERNVQTKDEKDILFAFFLDNCEY